MSHVSIERAHLRNSPQPFPLNLKNAVEQSLLISFSRKECKEHKEEGVFLDYTSSFSFMAIHPIGEKIETENQSL